MIVFRTGHCYINVEISAQIWTKTEERVRKCVLLTLEDMKVAKLHMKW